MRTTLIILIWHIFTVCDAQRIVVVDSIQKTPLSFTAIKYEGGGFYTNEIGRFQLNNVNCDRFELSLLGYKTKYLAKASVKDTIFLCSNPTMLDEVVVNNRLEKVTIYKKPRKTNFFGGSMLSTRVGVCMILIPDSSMVDSKVDDVTFYFMRERWMKRERKDVMENVDAFVRINIHKVENEKPTKQIFASEPIKINGLKKDEILLDLKNQWITIPKEGISFSIEMLGFYDTKYNEIVSDEFYVRVMLTPDTYKHFKSYTYYKFPFKHEEFLSTVNRHLDSPEYAKYGSRTLAIGMTLRQ
ncbi:MAG: hypothetical protein R2797_00485 [Gelidibacter sp.]